jgi:putative DNA primase/helicase
MDRPEKVWELAKNTVRDIYVEAARNGDRDLRKTIANWAVRSESAQRIRGMLELAQSEPGIPVSIDELDRDPWLFNVMNGTVDLRTGELRDHTKEDLITKVAPVAYIPGIDCSLWTSFLDRIMRGDRERIGYLRRFAGYCLTGDVRERVVVFAHGEGANGKTVFHTTIGGMMGPYAVRTPVESLLVKRIGAIPNDLARLRGARFVYASEAEESHKMAEALVKDMSGGDTLVARYLYKEWFQFAPTFKIYLSTNHKPQIKGTEQAIWDRIRLVPFNVRIPEEEQDKELKSKLEDEFPGILNWAIEGCLEWYREGLGMPEEVREATDEYRAEMDRVGAFISECCIVEPSATVGVGELYEAYKEWCRSSDEEELKESKFGRELRKRGFESKRTGDKRFRKGLRLK